jgi:hypothetical protein
MQIATRCLTGNLSGRPTIASAFACPGIPGYIFIEGRPCDVSAAVRGLVTVYGEPRLVPSDECSMLLSRRSPLHRRVHEGKWVRCLHGLYRGDVGLVCGHNRSEADVTIAFIPCIPEKASGSAKRKRPGRPEPCKWTAAEVKAMWGKRVCKLSEEDYWLNNERYKSGLVIKYLPPASVVIADPPLDIGPFISTKYISNLPFFSSVGYRNAQTSIQVGHRVKVIVGEQRGVVGHTTDVCNGMATVTLQVDEGIPPLIISLRALSIQYSPGDHIKHRFAKSQGILSTIDEDCRAVTYVEKDTNEEVCTTVLLYYTINIPLQYLAHMDAIEPYSPPCNYFRFTPGLWVHFSGPRDSDRPKCRGYITAVEEDHALVTDELMFTEVSNKLSSQAELTLDSVQDRYTRA